MPQLATVPESLSPTVVSYCTSRGLLPHLHTAIQLVREHFDREP